MNKKLKKNLIIALALIGLVALAVTYPLFLLAYLLIGFYDVLRNSPADPSVIRQYFLNNGILTWVLSPINLLMDLLTLPFINKKVYQLADLPQDCQQEINTIIATAEQYNVVDMLDKEMEGKSRGMVFFKWYGTNLDTSFDIPEYHQQYKYIKTIGISVFNKKVSTKRHFGPLRTTLRVLYNINDVTSPDAYIKVGDVENRWRDNKMFIFDDTLLHQSFNETSDVRYCLFIDIMRPSLMPWLMGAIVTAFSFGFIKLNGVFYKNWTMLK
jgi:beta-hydroxylase